MRHLVLLLIGIVFCLIFMPLYKIKTSFTFVSVTSARRYLMLIGYSPIGLYRVNNAGEFNSPFGKYKNPNIVNEPVIKAVSKYLNSDRIQISNGDYEVILRVI